MALSRRTGARFQASIWPGFVDAMTGLLLVLMFVLTIFMVMQFVLTERISGQETELDALSDEVAVLAQALGLERQTSSDLEAQLGNLRSALADAEAQAETQADLIGRLRTERDARAAELAQSNERITAFEARVASLVASRDDALERIAALSEEVEAADERVAGLQSRQAELLDEQEALNAALAASRIENDEQAEAARLAAARREALQALVADLRSRNTEAAADIVALREDVTAAEEAFSEEQAARLAEAAAAEALRARLEEADAELTAMTMSLEAQRREAEETLTLLAAARAAEEDLDAALAAAMADQQALTTQLEEMRDSEANEIALLRAALAEAEGRAETLTGQLDDSTERTVALEQQLAEARERAADVAGEATDSEERIATLLGQVAESQARADAMARQLSDTRARAEQLSQRLSLEKASMTDEMDALRARLRAALAAKLAAENTAETQMSEAEQRAVLLAEARRALAEEEAAATRAQRQTELLNQQVADLRAQLDNLQGLLDLAVAEDAAREVELQSLGSRLNTALARVAAEQKKRAELEAAERARLEAEREDLERYRSEFFGQLRNLLGNQEGVRIEGDRFVFSSEVLFPPGQAALSGEGQREIAKVAGILRNVASDIPEGIDWVIRVDGHTDDQPLSGEGRFADNWELSQARALSVVRYMSDFLGIPPQRLSANGFGQYQPVDTANTDEARARNRRIELKFTEK